MGSIKLKSNVNITVNYKGIAVKNMKYHNRGTNVLWYFLCNCLTLTYYDKLNAPNYIRVVYTDDTTSTLVPISDRFTKLKNDNYVAYFSATIPGVVIGANKSVKAIELFNQNNYVDPMAIVNLTDIITMGGNPEDSSVIITWEMSFSNPSGV